MPKFLKLQPNRETDGQFPEFSSFFSDFRKKLAAKHADQNIILFHSVIHHNLASSIAIDRLVNEANILKVDSLGVFQNFLLHF